MPRQTSKLLVLLLILAVAPATAAQRLTAARHGSGCPHDTARTAHAGNAPQRGGVGGMKITLFERIPSNGISLGIDRPSGAFLP